MENFTPVSAVLLWFNGRIAGISGIFNGLLSPQRGETAWRRVSGHGICGLGRLSDLDRPLILRAAIFGLGWGVAGYRPRPGDRRPRARRLGGAGVRRRPRRRVADL